MRVFKFLALVPLLVVVAGCVHVKESSGTANAGQIQERLGRLLPFIDAMAPVDGRTSVFVCRNQTCRAPATTVQELEGALTA